MKQIKGDKKEIKGDRREAYLVVECHREGDGGGGGRIGDSQIVVGAVGLSLSHCVVI